jgi:hypothetical protein
MCISDRSTVIILYYWPVELQLIVLLAPAVLHLSLPVRVFGSERHIPLWYKQSSTNIVFDGVQSLDECLLDSLCREECVQ